MAERLLLEGSDLAELMAHVRQEFGPHAKVIRAERIRQGGFAGFFAKEKYELTVDVPQMPPAPVRPLRSHRPPPSSLEELLDAADAEEQQLRPDPDQARAAIAARPDQAAQAAKPRAATAGSQFATVLDQVRALADEGVPAEAFVPLAPSAPPGAAPAAAGPPGTGGVPPAPAPLGLPGSATVPDPGAQAAGERLRAALTGLGVPAELLAGDPLTLTSVLDAVPPGPPPPRGPGQVLALVGSTADLAAVVPLLVDRMRLAVADVVAVGGTGRLVLGALGAQAPTQLGDTTSMTSWRARAATARHPWLVVVEAESDAEGRARAAELVGACRPDQVWAVLDARLKPADATRWLADVGAHRPVDALAVRALLDTAAPGTVLGLGRPVAWLDGLPTSRLVWAAVLGQPLDAALG